jgi:hypothetical protein
MTTQTTATRESLEQPGPYVRRAEGEELLVRVGAVAAADCERATGQHVVGIPDEQHTSRRQQQGGVITQRRQAGHRQAGRELPDDGDALVLQVEHRRQNGRQQDCQQRAGQAGPAPRDHEQKRQRADTQQQCAPLHLVELTEERPQLAEQRIPGHVYPGDLAQLPDDHDHGDAGEVAHQDRRGQQVGDRAESQHPPDNGENANDHRQRGGERGVPSRVAGRHRSDDRSRHDRAGGLRPHGQLPGRAHQGIQGQ